MLTHEEIAGNWDRIRGRLKRRWGELTDDDLTQAKGTFQELVGRIEQRTGAIRQEIEDEVNEAIREEAGWRDYAKIVAEKQMHEWSQAASEGARRAGQAGSYYQDQLEDLVRRAPTKTLCSAFMIGMAAGVLLALPVRR